MVDYLSSPYRYHEIVVDGQDPTNIGTLNEIKYFLPQVIQKAVAAKVISVQIPFTFDTGEEDYTLSLGHLLYFEWAGSNTWCHHATAPGWTNVFKSVLNRGLYWENAITITQQDLKDRTQNDGGLTAASLETYLNTVVLPQLIDSSPSQTNIYWYDKFPLISKLPKALTLSIANENDAVPKMVFGTPFQVTGVNTYAPYQQRSYVVYNNLSGAFAVTPSGNVASASSWKVTLQLTFTIDNSGLVVPPKTVAGKVGAKDFDYFGWGTGGAAVGVNDGFNSATTKNTIASTSYTGTIPCSPLGLHSLVWVPYLHVTTPDQSSALNSISSLIPTSRTAQPCLSTYLDQTSAFPYEKPTFDTQAPITSLIQPNGPCYLSDGRIGSASYGSYVGDDLWWRQWNTNGCAPVGLAYSADSISNEQWLSASILIGGGPKNVGGF
ncbi:MAG TPA: hypothetical protein VFM18_14010, partial [Methanosarcina sp.]|nr:hypothetical protein [Methanosarcina sp.]